MVIMSTIDTFHGAQVPMCGITKTCSSRLFIEQNDDETRNQLDHPAPP